MSTLAELETPKFPFSMPEDIKAASEKALNLWVGALSPLWLPYWAATSFGIGAWALTRGLSKTTGLYKNLLPGLKKVVAEVEAAEDAVSAPVAKAVEEETAVATQIAAEAETITDKAVAAAQDAIDEVASTLAPIETVIDPVIEAPVTAPLATAPAPKPIALSATTKPAVHKPRKS